MKIIIFNSFILNLHFMHFRATGGTLCFHYKEWIWGLYEILKALNSYLGRKKILKVYARRALVIDMKVRSEVFLYSKF